MRQTNIREKKHAVEMKVWRVMFFNFGIIFSFLINWAVNKSSQHCDLSLQYATLSK